jgi:hypothetical protein
VPFGPSQFDTACGFKVQGAKVERTVQNGVDVELLGSQGTEVRVNLGPVEASTVMLVLTNGTGVAVPALPNFIAALSFDGGQLVDVSYEPSANSLRWSDYTSGADELRSLRASIAASARLGVFRLNEEDELALARRMQQSNGIDPSVALYAAYAYNHLQRHNAINQMQAVMLGDLGLTFFDIAFLSTSPRVGRIVPAFPLLSQGWALLSAYRAELPQSIRGIERHRLPSLWTVFDRTAVERLEAAIRSGAVR